MVCAWCSRAMHPPRRCTRHRTLSVSESEHIHVVDAQPLTIHVGGGDWIPTMILRKARHRTFPCASCRCMPTVEEICVLGHGPRFQERGQKVRTYLSELERRAAETDAGQMRTAANVRKTWRRWRRIAMTIRRISEAKGFSSPGSSASKRWGPRTAAPFLVADEVGLGKTVVARTILQS